MSTWSSRGLRGSTLEELVNRTNERYQELGLALIQKIPTPITPIEIDKNSRHITLAYFDQKSTVDYIGAVQGIPVCFDAKECAENTFALKNVHPHQVAFMRRFEKQEGVAFLLIGFSARAQYYYLRLREFMTFWERAERGGRKSFRIEELEERFFLKEEESGALRGILVPYLEGLRLDLEERGQGQETTEHREDGHR